MMIVSIDDINRDDFLHIYCIKENIWHDRFQVYSILIEAKNFRTLYNK